MNELDTQLGKWVKRSIWGLVATVFVISMAWANLFFKVEAHEAMLQQGQRFTLKDGTILELKIERNAERIDTVEANLKEILDEIKDDIKLIKEALGK